MTGQLLPKKLNRLMRRIGQLTDGQATLDDIDWDEWDCNEFSVTIRPNGGYYKGGRFRFKVTFPDGLEGISHPIICCMTPIYHPNIDSPPQNPDRYSNICLPDIQGDRWHPVHGIEGIVLGLLFLLYNPNLDDPLNGDLRTTDFDTFVKNVEEYMSTGCVEGEDYGTDFRYSDGKFHDLRDSNNKDANANSDSTYYGEDGTSETESNTTKTSLVDTPGIDTDIKKDYVVPEEGAMCKTDNNVADFQNDLADSDFSTNNVKCCEKNSATPNALDLSLQDCDEYTDDENEEDLQPVTFVMEDSCDGYDADYYIAFGNISEDNPCERADTDICPQYALHANTATDETDMNIKDDKGVVDVQGAIGYNALDMENSGFDSRNHDLPYNYETGAISASHNKVCENHELPKARSMIDIIVSTLQKIPCLSRSISVPN